MKSSIFTINCTEQIKRVFFCCFKATLLIILAASSLSSIAQDNSLQANTRSLINLLDYISQDYKNAVENGKIINEAEYQEMLDFSEEAHSFFHSISQQTDIKNKDEINARLTSVRNVILKKGDEDIIARDAQEAKKQVIALNLINIAPVHYPDISEGKKLYQASCKSCHGDKGGGDGPAGLGLDPEPTNFLDQTIMKYVSPLQVFNTTRLGVQGTGMRAFDELSDDQIWQIAFYIKSLNFENDLPVSKDSLENFFKKSQVDHHLSDIAHLSDEELKMRFPENERDVALAAFRLHQPGKNANTSLNLALAYLTDALAFYKNNNTDAARQRALFAYLDGVEPVEKQLRALDSKIVGKLELEMNSIRSGIKQGVSTDELTQRVDVAKATIAKASRLLGEQTYTFWFSFLIAGSILLREGLEAVLIIITILGLLKSVGAREAIMWVHGGWIAAVGIGVASWFFTGWLMSFGTQNIEILEATGSLLAVAILIYVGFWLHNKTEAKKWQHFVNDRITSLLDQKKLFGLAFISFIVVFREAFESILFLSSMQLQVDDSSRPGIWMGALTAIAGVILIAVLLLRFAAHVPIRKLFQYSAIIILLFAIVLAGQGIHALQEAGMVSVTSAPINFHSRVLGIFPTLETWAAQMVVIALCGALWWRNSNRGKIKQAGQLDRIEKVMEETADQNKALNEVSTRV